MLTFGNMIRAFLLYFFLMFSLTTLAQPEREAEAYALGVEGIQLIDEGQYEPGIKLLKRAWKLAPKEYDYPFEIGKAYLQNNNPKQAEKYLYELQYHAQAQADLYLTLARCYAALNAQKKTPDVERKKELDALRYGIQRLPFAGKLYLALGTKQLEQGQHLQALAVFESGIKHAPNFAENYFWAAKLMMASGNPLWGWFYAEACFNMTDDDELMRSSAVLISTNLEAVFAPGWQAHPEKLDQDFAFVLTQSCSNTSNKQALQLEKRTCLLAHWDFEDYSIAPLFMRMKKLQTLGLLEPYLATIVHENDKEVFLKWLAHNPQLFEKYTVWRYWNPMQIQTPIQRL